MNLNVIKPYFPQAFKANDVKSLVIALLIYAVVVCIGNPILGLLSVIPIIGFVFSVINWVLRVYCAAGIILALLVFLKIVK